MKKPQNKRKSPKKNRKRTITSRQNKAKCNIAENIGTKGQALRDAGYSKSYSESPDKFAKTKAGQELIKMCNDLRDKSLKHAAQKLVDASYAEGVRGAETLNKISRLEKGESDGEREIVIRIETFKS